MKILFLENDCYSKLYHILYNYGQYTQKLKYHKIILSVI